MTTMMNEHAPQTPRQGVRVFLRVMLLVGDYHIALGDAEIACDTPAVRAWLAQAPLMPLPESAASLSPAFLSAELRQRLATLCGRLGVAEPAYDQLGEQEAGAFLARLQAEEEELLQTAAHARTPPSSEHSASSIEKGLIRQLKERWRARFRPQGSVDDLLSDWEHFKQRTCGEAVSDRTMRADQYEKLLAAFVSPATER